MLMLGFRLGEMVKVSASKRGFIGIEDKGQARWAGHQWPINWWCSLLLRMAMGEDCPENNGGLIHGALFLSQIRGLWNDKTTKARHSVDTAITPS